MIDFDDSLVLSRPSIGMLLKFLKGAVPYHVHSHCRVGNGYVYYGREDNEDTVLATYTFGKNCGLPIFEFKDFGYEMTDETYRRGLERALNTYRLFEKDAWKQDAYLGDLIWREPLSKDKKQANLFFNMDTFFVKIKDILDQKDARTVAGFAFKDNSSYPVEKEVYHRIWAYMKCRAGYTSYIKDEGG